MNLKGKVAVLIGGTRMGKGIGLALSERGCSVIFGYRRSKTEAINAVKEIHRIGGSAACLSLKLTSLKLAKTGFRSIKNVFGRVDIIVNMASEYEQTPLKDIDDSNLHQAMESNVLSGFRLVMAAREELIRRKGRVVNFSDWVAASGRPRYKNFVPYYTGKTAVLGMTQSLALELAPDVLVNTVAPGPILAPIRMRSIEKKVVEKATPLGKWGGVQEIVKAVLFLCETDFVTGECLRIDGGRHLL